MCIRDRTHPIPGNDDAIRAIRLLSNLMADAALEGLQIRDKESAERAAVEAAERQEGLDDEDIATDPGAAEEPTLSLIHI